MKKSLFSIAFVAILGAAYAGTADQCIYDTGVNNPVNFNAALTNLGLSSGNIGAGLENRWYAMPFTIGTGGATINKIWARGFTPVGFEFDQLGVRIYSRSGLATAPNINAPVANFTVTQNAGLAWAPIADPRYPAEGEGGIFRLHVLQGFTPVTLPAGEYWISIYAAHGLGDQAPLCNFAWFVGGSGDNVNMNREAGYYRSATLAGGYLPYAPTTITPYSFMGQAAERWNASFTLWGSAAKAARQVSGNVMFNDYAGNAAPYDDATNPKPLDFLYRVAVTDPNNSGAVVAFRYLRTMTQSSATVDPNNFMSTLPYGYVLPTAAAGVTDTDLVFQTNNWLGVRNSANVSVSGDIVRDWSLINGDIDVDGEIGPSDFGELSTHYGETAAGGTYADWAAWVGSTAGQADLDEDGEVGPADFGILSSGYGQTSE